MKRSRFPPTSPASAEIAGVVEEAIRRHGRIDVLHNNVGITEMGDPIEATEESWDRVMAVNLKSVFLACKHVLPVMQAQRKGAIVNISSIAAVAVNDYPYFSYYASKSGLNHLTRALAVRYAPFGIRANAIMPGLMDTPLIYREIAGQYADKEAMVQRPQRHGPDGLHGRCLRRGARGRVSRLRRRTLYHRRLPCRRRRAELQGLNTMPRVEINEPLRADADALPRALGAAELARRRLGSRGVRLIVGAIDRVIGRIVETLAGVLVALETLILFAGVVARYVLHAPLVWSDELASILFLWLAMLGAVIAYRRAEHMRMSALIDKAAPRTARLLRGARALRRPRLPRLRAEACDRIRGGRGGRGDAGARNLDRLACRRASGRHRPHASRGARAHRRRARGSPISLSPSALIAGVSLTLMLAGPSLSALGNYKLILFFVLLTGGAVLAGIPIAFAFGIGTFAFLASTTRLPMTVVIGRLDEGMSHIILLAVPLFVFLGLLIEITGLARHMVGFLATLIGHVRGGLHYVLLAAMYLVSGISGSKAADMAAVAPVLFPEMKARGASGGDLVALLAATGAQTETIPPSLVLITIGSVTGVSISAMFTGGLLPGAVMAVMLAGVVWWRGSRDGGERGRRARARPSSCAPSPPLCLGSILPFVIRAAVVEGIATATEVSTIGVIYGFAYALVAASLFGQKIAWRRVWPALVDTAALSGAILFIIGTATGMAWALTQSGFSRTLAEVMTGMPGGSASFMAASIAAFMILGSVLEGIPSIVLFGPLLFPIARAVGIHEVHYAMVVILAMGIGLFAPPFGVGYYTACAIGRIDPAEGLRAIWPYMLSLLLGLALVAAIPWISIGFLR